MSTQTRKIFWNGHMERTRPIAGVSSDSCIAWGTARTWSESHQTLGRLSSGRSSIAASTPANKILLLQQLKRAGVWLVDASIIGINERDPSLKSRIVAESWDAYTGPSIEKLDPPPRGIIVIGYGVAKTLQNRLKRLNIPTHPIPQPQGWRKPGYTKFYRECFDICSKIAQPIHSE